MNPVIIINGRGGSGKSTFIKLCSEFNSNVIETSTVDIVKKIALEICWDGQKDERGRRFLSDLKDALERYNDLPNQYVEHLLVSYPDMIVFVNAREPRNIQYYKEKYGALTVLVKRPSTEDKVYGNHADDEAENYDYDMIINNDGDLEHLRELAKTFMKYVESYFKIKKCEQISLFDGGIEND